MNNLNGIKITSSWDEDFYSYKGCMPSPVNSVYYNKKPYRLLYDGIYNADGNIMEFQVGIMSNEAGYYEFFVEDFFGNSFCKHFPDFPEALKKFKKLTNIRKPIVYNDDKEGNAIKEDFRDKPYAIISK